MSEKSVRDAFRSVDDIDWEMLHSYIPDSGHGRFWKAVFDEVRIALDKESRLNGTGESDKGRESPT